jgi:hypothetical protein
METDTDGTDGTDDGGSGEIDEGVDGEARLIDAAAGAGGAAHGADGGGSDEGSGGGSGGGPGGVGGIVGLLAMVASVDEVQPGELERAALANPRLLDPVLQSDLREAARVGPDAELLAGALDRLAALTERYDADPSELDLGDGPVERLVNEIGRGEISEKAAIEQASEPSFGADMAPVYVQRLRLHALMAGHGGEPQQAVLVLRLTLAALRWREGGGRVLESHVRETVLALLNVADLALVERADRRLLDEARAAGDHLAGAAAAAGQTEVVGRTLYALGDLCTHPYMAGRYSATFAGDHESWQAASRAALGYRGQAEADRVTMPEPDEALSLGEDYLRRSIDYLDGSEKGQAIYALIGTLVVRQVLAHPDAADDPVVPPEVRELGLAALPLLADSDHDLRARLGVLDILDRTGTDPDPSAGDVVPVEELVRLVEVPVDELVRRLGGVQALDVQFRLATLLRRRDTPRALGVLQRMRPLAKAHGDEAARRHQLAQEYAYIGRAWAPELASLPPDTELNDAVALANQLGRAAGWDARAQGAGALELALRATSAVQVGPALGFLAQAESVAPHLCAAHADAVAMQRWVVTFGAMGDPGVTGDPRQVVGAAEQALQIALDLELPGLAERTLEGVEVHMAGEPAMARPVCSLLMGWALKLEDALGEATGEQVWRLCVRALAVLVNQVESPADIDRIIALLQLGKGLRFAAAYDFPAGWLSRVESVGRDELQAIRELQDVVGDVPEPAPAVSPVDGGADDDDLVRRQDELIDEQLLTSYARPDAASGGTTPHQRLANLQERYDESLSSALLQGARERPPVLLSGVDLSRAIDERSIVVVLFVGADMRGMLTVYSFAFTEDRIGQSATINDIPLAHAWFGNAERELLVSPLAPAVTTLRADLLADPGLRDVAPAAGDRLAADEHAYLGDLRAQLDQMKADSGGEKDHLVFVPHGPLHFHPLHLLGERPLADDWIVTYLPALSMVAPRRGLPSLAHRPQRRAAVLGMGFDHDARPGLGPLPGSRREAEAVAATLETTAVLDGDCTAGAVLAGLTSSYWAHLSTHGRHNVAAPAFQSLYVTPDQHFPGRLEAHDVLGFDLRNLDLLTLSACETSLGRFDIRDNLRGLPASFLLAGVETLIGTLWPVEVNASERFFTTLYRHLADGTGKLDAFRLAQTATRAEHPAFRDWGAFHYVGQW